MFDLRSCFSCDVTDHTDGFLDPPTDAPPSKVLLTGSFPSAAFVHIAVRHALLGPDRTALVVCKSFAELHEGVVNENDRSLTDSDDSEQTKLTGPRGDWLIRHLATLKDRIQIIELPTLAHLRFFLASMHADTTVTRADRSDSTADTEEASPSKGQRKSRDDRLPRTAYLGAEPTLFVLESPSDWLDDSLTEQAWNTIDEYTSILALFASQTRHVAPKAELVIIDKAANRIELPVLAANKRREGDDGEISLVRAAAFFVDLIAESKRVEGEMSYAAGREPYVDHSIVLTRSPWSRSHRTVESELVFRKHAHFEDTPESCSFEILSHMKREG